MYRLKQAGGYTSAGAIAALVAILVVVGVFGYGIYYMGSTADSATNERCVVYSGGTFEDKHFIGFTEPGSTKAIIGWGSDQYCYRNDQRDYITGTPEQVGNKDADASPVVVVGGSSGDTNSSVRLSVDYQLYMKLNMDDRVLRKFHENIGIKTHAFQENGWRDMLNQYFRPQIERSLEAAALSYPWDELYTSEQTRKEYQADVIKRLKKAIRDVVGDNYFCGPTYVQGGECGDFTLTIGKPDLVNADLVAAIESEETAKRQTQAQSEKNATAERKLDVDKRLIELYGPNGALVSKAIDSGKVTFYVLPDGTSVPVPAPAPKQGE